MRIYGLFDRKMKQYGSVMLFLSVNDDTMRRQLQENVPEHAFERKHAEDFDLFWLGAISLETGTIATQVPILVENLALVFRAPAVERAQMFGGVLDPALPRSGGIDPEGPHAALLRPSDR